MLSVKHLTLGIIALSAISCTKNFDKINTNDNAATDSKPQNLLAGVINQSDAQVAFGSNFIFGSCFSQQTAEPQYNEMDRYMIEDGIGSVSNLWRNSYRAIKNSNNLIYKSEKIGLDSYKAAAMILKAVNYTTLADYFGDIPYSEATDYDVDNLLGTAQPKFDNQLDVYKGILSNLKEAASILAESNDAIESTDYIYNGDIQKWQRLANALQIRIYMKLSNVSSIPVATELSRLINEPIFTSELDDALVSYGTSSSTWSPVFENLRSRTDYSSSKTMIDYLLSTSDPRISAYAQKGGSDDYEGYPTGALTIAEKGNISKIGTLYGYAPEASGTIMTYAEQQLLLAEAMELGLVLGDAKSTYESAITADLKRNNIPTSEISTFLSSSGNYDNATDKLEFIRTQLWVATFMEGNEGYNLIRRTGSPSFIDEPLNSVSSGNGIIQRLTYPPREKATNEANMLSAQQKQGLTGIINSDIFIPLDWAKK